MADSDDMDEDEDEDCAIEDWNVEVLLPSNNWVDMNKITRRILERRISKKV
jgi:hypothetical protein